MSQYSEEVKAEALIRLALNQHNIEKTSEELGIGRKTLLRWARGEGVIPASRFAQKDQPPPEDSAVHVDTQIRLGRMDQQQSLILDVPLALEAALHRLLELIPERWDGNSWAVAVGILTDKYILFRGNSADRVSTITKLLEEMNDRELDELLSQFQAIATRRTSLSLGDGQTEDDTELVHMAELAQADLS